MCSISMFTADELLLLAAQERSKGNKKEALRLMKLAYYAANRVN